jgi:hypothetical protein
LAVGDAVDDASGVLAVLGAVRGVDLVVDRAVSILLSSSLVHAVGLVL